MRTFRVLPLVLAFAATYALPGADPHAASPAAWRVIVNPSNPVANVERRFLADIFLKKITRWSTGDGIRPVDQRQETFSRQRFSEDVLDRSVASIKSYWIQLVFSGRDVPPPELDTDDDVVRFVLKNVGAVGYVSASADVGRAKVLMVR